VAKIDLTALLNKMREAKEDKESLAQTAARVLAENGRSDDDSVVAGKITPKKATEVEAMVEALIEKFEAEETFNWRVHILDTTDTIIEIIKAVGDFGDRPLLEDLVVEIIADLFKRYNPKIPYVPQFIGKFVKSKIVDTLVPFLVDWILDKIYGED